MKTNGYDRYCDHEWTRDDQHSMICVKCHARKDYKRTAK